MTTPRAITSPETLDELDFAKADGLVPVIVQDTGSLAVLMLAFANREALEATLLSGEMHFWSRSRGELWRKGATSGNTMRLVSLHVDCDADTVLARVSPAGPACHTGTTTCFEAEEGSPAGGATDPEDRVGTPESGAVRPSRTDTLQRLDRTLEARAADRPEGSYTVRLLDDPNLRLKKLGEETAELVAALATSDRERAAEESADLIYHILVALRAEGLGLDSVLAALEDRAG